jgi:iron complex transport system ATP-binding protein
VTIGTPEDLSIDGCLSNFFSRKGIVFDMETGLFRIDNEFEKEVCLVGHGNKYAMVRKALQRNGILASRRVESDFYIETGDMTTSGYISREDDKGRYHRGIVRTGHCYIGFRLAAASK